MDFHVIATSLSDLCKLGCDIVVLSQPSRTIFRLFLVMSRSVL